MSNLFDEELLEGSSPYKDLKMGETLKNGEAACLFYVSKFEGVSEHGKFTAYQGVTFNPEAKSTEELLESVELAYVIPNTMLTNTMRNTGMIKGEAYKFVKKWSKGDKFEGVKKGARGHGFDLVHLKANDNLLEALKAKHDELLPDDFLDSAGSEESDDTSSNEDVKV